MKLITRRSVLSTRQPQSQAGETPGCVRGQLLQLIAGVSWDVKIAEDISRTSPHSQFFVVSRNQDVSKEKGDVIIHEQRRPLCWINNQTHVIIIIQRKSGTTLSTRVVAVVHGFVLPPRFQVKGNQLVHIKSLRGLRITG